MPEDCSMPAARSLLECQRQFMAALYGAAEDGPTAVIEGNGLEPAARMRIYRHICKAAQAAALRTAYPAVFALVGADFFDQCARGYRRVHPSRTGNLQDFGVAFADYLATLPAARTLPWLGDVARLEWLRQQAALAAHAPVLASDVAARLVSAATLTLHPSVRRLASPHAVLTIFRYALQPGDADLQLSETGEQVVLWREGDEVAMAALDPASFACLDAIARGDSLADAATAARGVDPEFDAPACLDSFVRHGLIVAAAEPGLAVRRGPVPASAMTGDP